MVAMSVKIASPAVAKASSERLATAWFPAPQASVTRSHDAERAATEAGETAEHLADVERQAAEVEVRLALLALACDDARREVDPVVDGGYRSHPNEVLRIRARRR
jgi:hypothetical protein